MRSSDRRKVVDQIIADYTIEVPQTTGEEQNEGQAQASGIGALRNSLLPDGALSAKFSTTVGHDLKTVSGTVYVGAHEAGDQRVLWVKLEERIIPTVYTLWLHPGLLPLLHTPNIVLEKMRGGADLMTPGLARGPPFPFKAVKGATVAIASYENPSVPLIVGECEIDVASLTSVRGTKGHAVRGIHFQGDEIWSWSHNNKPGTDPPDRLDGWYEETTDLDDVQQGVEDLDLEQDGGVLVQRPDDTNAEDGEDDTLDESAPPPKEWMTKGKICSLTRICLMSVDIDEAFRNAFLYALHSIRETRKGEPNYGIEFPIQQSQLVSNYIQTYLPTFTPNDTAALQIKKTSWKNIKKFIKALDKEVLLKSKDRNGGETVILDIDFDDEKILSFTPYALPRKSTTTSDPTSSSSTAGGSDPSLNQTLKRLTLYKPKASLAPLFAPSKAPLTSFYLPTELRPILTTYLESEALIPPQNKRLATLDPILANTLFDPSSAPDAEALARGSAPRDSLLDRLLSHGCAVHHLILRNDETRDSPNAKPRPGSAPNIKLALETRTGNKTATKVSGLEAYGIRPAALAEELQKACASSTSTGLLAGASPKNPVVEVMVQGPQREAVIKALERRGVRKEWVEVVDRTKKKGGR